MSVQIPLAELETAIDEFYVYHDDRASELDKMVAFNINHLYDHARRDEVEFNNQHDARKLRFIRFYGEKGRARNRPRMRERFSDRFEGLIKDLPRGTISFVEYPVDENISICRLRGQYVKSIGEDNIRVQRIDSEKVAIYIGRPGEEVKRTAISSFVYPKLDRAKRGGKIYLPIAPWGKKYIVNTVRGYQNRERVKFDMKFTSKNVVVALRDTK